MQFAHKKESDMQKLSLIESRCVSFHLNYKILLGTGLRTYNIVLWQPLLISWPAKVDLSKRPLKRKFDWRLPSRGCEVSLTFSKILAFTTSNLLLYNKKPCELGIYLCNATIFVIAYVRKFSGIQLKAPTFPMHSSSLNARIKNQNYKDSLIEKCWQIKHFPSGVHILWCQSFT